MVEQVLGSQGIFWAVFSEIHPIPRNKETSCPKPSRSLLIHPKKAPPQGGRLIPAGVQLGRPAHGFPFPPQQPGQRKRTRRLFAAAPSIERIDPGGFFRSKITRRGWAVTNLAGLPSWAENLFDPDKGRIEIQLPGLFPQIHIFKSGGPGGRNDGERCGKTFPPSSSSRAFSLSPGQIPARYMDIAGFQGF